MKTNGRHALYWHSFFLAITTSFTEINTVMPALILEAGGGERTVGGLTAVMIGLPLISQLLFAGFLSTRERKKPFLLLGINLRIGALAGAAVAIAALGTDRSIIPAVFATMAVFALSGAFAGVSYTEMVGKVVDTAHRRRYFVNRQTISAIGLFISAVATRLFLGATSFPDGYITLFAIASVFLLVASLGFWALHEPAAVEYPDAGSIGEKAHRTGVSALTALSEVPAILRNDRNMRSLIITVNLGALGFTAIPLVTALAHRSYEVSPSMIGWFVILQVIGMLIANTVWSKVIRRGGFRTVVKWELILVTTLFPLALLASRIAPLWLYAGMYLVTGATVSAHRLGVDAVLVQISPDGKRALYAGIFGAANIATAVMPLVTGVLVTAVGFPPVFVGASVLSLLALIPAAKLWCGEWYRES